MIYTSFQIKNFRGVENVNIDLENNRIITLVGLNESGKTSIMEAIHNFYRLIKGKDLTAQELNEIRPKGIDFTGSVDISASLAFEKSDKKRIQEYWNEILKKRSNLEIPETFTYNFHFVFELHTYKETNITCTFMAKTSTSKSNLVDTDKDSWQKIIDFIKEQIVPEILYYDDFIFQIPERICFAKAGTEQTDEINNENNKIWQLVINDILKSVNDKMVFQNHVVDTWETDKDASSNRLAQMEKALDEKITSRWGDLFGKDRVNFREIKLDPEYAAGKLYISFKIRTKSKQEFLVKERSKGFKWFFSFLLFTEFRKKRTKNILFLLDEPASNLHSSAQTKITEALQELSKNSLVIYSTHSHHLIKPEWLSGAYVCINQDLSNDVLEGVLSTAEGAKITAVKYYSYVGKGLGKDNVSYFQPILDRLDYKPSFVEPIPDIVILEGKNDWYTFKYFEKYILNKKVLLNFYPGAGKDKLYDIIRLYLAWGRKFIVFLDGDAGEKTKKLYIKEFGSYMDDKIFSIEDVLNKKIATEELMGIVDQRTIYNKVFGSGTYDECKKNVPTKLKQNLNYAINQLFIGETSVNLQKTTKENFKKVFEFLKKKLSF